MKTICVADLKINIKSGDTEFFNRRLKDYEIPFVENPDMVMETYLYDEIPEPQGELVQTVKATKILQCDNGFLCRYIKSSKTGVIPFAIYFTKDYSNVKISLKKDYTFQNLSTTDWEYLYTGFMFANRLTVLGGTVLLIKITELSFLPTPEQENLPMFPYGKRNLGTICSLLMMISLR